MHYPPDGRLRVYRSRTGGGEWEPLTKGLPQEHCYVNVLRDAMAVDRLDECGVYFGTTGGQVYCSPDGGDTLGSDRARPAGRCCRSRCRRCRDLRVVLPYHLRTLAQVDGEVQLDAGPTPVPRSSTRSRPRTRRCAAPSATRPPASGGAFVRFFACREDLSHDAPDDAAARARCCAAQEPLLVVGAMAGG